MENQCFETTISSFYTIDRIVRRMGRTLINGFILRFVRRSGLETVRVLSSSEESGVPRVRKDTAKSTIRE